IDANIGPGMLDAMNEHTWRNALQMDDISVNTVTKAPTVIGWQHLSYVIHLLEDLTSPAHTRNDPHPCGGTHFKPLQIELIRCEVYERYNNDVTPNMPSATTS